MATSYQDRHRQILKPISLFLAKTGIHPNFITLLSFILTSTGVVWVLLEKPIIAFFWFLITAPLDAVDGYVARISGKTSKFGAFLDSTLDRITDSLLFLSFIYVFRWDMIIFILSVFSLICSYLISYTRARVEGLGGELKEGLMSRYPRLFGFLILLVIWGFLGMVWFRWAFAIYTSLLIFTVLQRIFLAYKKLSQK